MRLRIHFRGSGPVIHLRNGKAGTDARTKCEQDEVDVLFRHGPGVGQGVGPFIHAFLVLHSPSNSGVDRYRSAKDGMTTTMFLPSMPDLMPT